MLEHRVVSYTHAISKVKEKAAKESGAPSSDGHDYGKQEHW